MSEPLRILIAGAGIGGLAAALACSRAGHQVQVFEKSQALAAVGAGIQLGPNVTRILAAWGLADALRQVAAFPDRLHVRDAQSGEVLGQLRLGTDFEARYGAPYATVHRADLQQLLAQNLLEHQGVVPTLGHAVASFTQDDRAAQLHLSTADGRSPVRHGDLIVGADGLWSQIRQGLLGDGPPQDTGHVAYRCLVRQADLPAAARQGLKTHDVMVWLAPHLHVVHYPVQGCEWLNLVVIVDKRSKSKELGATANISAVKTAAQDWSQTADTDEWAGFKTHLTSDLQNLLSAADNQGAASPDTADAAGAWRKWHLFARPAMHGAQEHGCGRVALLGDAAHPMLPYLAQGAGMAIEDAQALASSLNRVSDVPTQIQHFARARWQGNALVQRRAVRNGQIFHASGMMRWGRDAAMRLAGERLLDMPWLYAHALCS